MFETYYPRPPWPERGGRDGELHQRCDVASGDGSVRPRRGPRLGILARERAEGRHRGHARQGGVTRGSKVFRAVIATFCDPARGRSILRSFALEGRQKEACMSSRTGRTKRTTPTETTT